MEHYVTLFDQAFLPQGLALYRSMVRHAGAFRLWILCLDEPCHAALTALALPHVGLLKLSEVETAELKQAAASRSRREYCWTLTPFTPGFVFAAAPDAERVTYLDADTWFCTSPSSLFRELEASAKAVLITRHAFAPEYDQAAKAGIYCVQFVTFVRERGEPVRRRWAEQCLEWCYSRYENGRFGDQMYLNEWPSRFPELVHVLQDRALTQAPWNCARFPPSEAALYHFHGLRTLRGGRVLLGEGYRIFTATVDAIYRPYLLDLAACMGLLSAHGIATRPQIDKPLLSVWIMSRLRGLGLWIKRRTWRLFHRLPDSHHSQH